MNGISGYGSKWVFNPENVYPIKKTSICPKKVFTEREYILGTPRNTYVVYIKKE